MSAALRTSEPNCLGKASFAREFINPPIGRATQIRPLIGAFKVAQVTLAQSECKWANETYRLL